MIPSAIVTVAASHAVGLEDFVLVPGNGNTVLAGLVEAAMPAAMCLPAEGHDGYEDYPEAICSTAEVGNEGSIYNQRIQCAAEELAPIVASHLSVTRNIVRPDVKRFAELIRNVLDEDRRTAPDYRYDIVKVDIPSLVTNESFHDLLLGQRRSEERPTKTLDLDIRTVDELRDMMLVGKESMDKAIQEWFATVGSERLQRIWIGVFGKAALGGAGLSVAAIDMPMNSIELINDLITVLLLARRLDVEIAPDATMPRTNYSDILGMIIGWASARLAREVTRVKNHLSNKRLVISVNKAKQVLVYNDVYQEFLKNGGKPEAVLGNALNEAYNSMEDIAANSERLVREWNLYVVAVEQAYRQQAKNRVRSGIAVLASNFELQADGAELVKEASAKYTGLSKEVEAYIDDVISNIEVTDSLCEYHLASKIVANGFYRFTAAYSLLGYMEEITSIMPDMDIREVALMAAANYLADYLTDQIVVK